ncbi:DUF4189 domain-containing protein [Nocardia terpenica]|uniref:DUF4189 domain-containing protein n=1 Tax=Nocardia terpenica TaxID=455432 RepID=UPI002B4AD475|nr:DUF4189 domain-containing protein [Nocardia terpenica]
MTAVAVLPAATATALVSPAHPAHASGGDRYGAFAVSESTGRHGRAVNYDSSSSAEARAVALCGRGDCRREARSEALSKNKSGAHIVGRACTSGYGD